MRQAIKEAFVQGIGVHSAFLPQAGILSKASPLFDGIRELAKAIGKFEATDEQLKPFGDAGIAGR